MYQTKIFVLGLTLSLVLGLNLAFADSITQYQAISKFGYSKTTQKHGLAIRHFFKNNQPYFMVLWPHSIDFQSIPEQNWIPSNKKISILPLNWTIDGLKYGPSQQGYYLTLDLCPSKKPLDKAQLNRLIDYFPNPVPVGVAITSDWIKHHKEDWEFLNQLNTQKKITISWINHSHTHPYDSKKPLNQTFLLTPSLNVEEQWLALEKTLIENNVTPTLLCRFPGLISNEALLKQVKALHLVPLNAQAWMAKGEVPTVNGIILLHANGNEPEGWKRFWHWVEKQGTKNITLNSLELSQ